MASQQKNVRQRILDTALDIVENEGMKALTQPRIAKACGLRQSHLTYYFPRKADLYVALLDASHRRAEQKAGKAEIPPDEMLAALFFEPERMRFFLSIVLEVGDDPELGSVLRDHARGLCVEIAARIERDPGDPHVHSFVDELRGLGLRVLMGWKPTGDRLALLRSVAERHGLTLSA